MSDLATTAAHLTKRCTPTPIFAMAAGKPNLPDFKTSRESAASFLGRTLKEAPDLAKMAANSDET